MKYPPSQTSLGLCFDMVALNAYTSLSKSSAVYIQQILSTERSPLDVFAEQFEPGHAITNQVLP